MRKLILRWLFGTDDISNYLELLVKNRDLHQENINRINAHLKEIEERKEDLDNILKLIKICKNHGIDVDKEIKNIEL